MTNAIDLVADGSDEPTAQGAAPVFDLPLEETWREPVVLNGSPLSYWAGEPGINPMRVAGGLLGGAWLTHFIADLGDGRFDGAWLAQNFENLQPEKAA